MASQMSFPRETLALTVAPPTNRLTARTTIKKKQNNLALRMARSVIRGQLPGCVQIARFERRSHEQELFEGQTQLAIPPLKKKEGVHIQDLVAHHQRHVERCRRRRISGEVNVRLSLRGFDDGARLWRVIFRPPKPQDIALCRCAHLP